MRWYPSQSRYRAHPAHEEGQKGQAYLMNGIPRAVHSCPHLHCEDLEARTQRRGVCSPFHVLLHFTHSLTCSFTCHSSAAAGARPCGRHHSDPMVSPWGPQAGGEADTEAHVTAQAAGRRGLGPAWKG